VENIINYEELDLSKFSTEELKQILTKENINKSLANTQQMNKKILINSLYGALGSDYFRFYDVTNAEAVTSFGQLAIKWVQNALNVYLNKVNRTDNVDYIVYIDTDSVYVDLEQFMNIANKNMNHEGEKLVDFMSLLCEKITESVINVCYANLKEYMNNIENHMEMDREVISLCLTGDSIVKTDRGDKQLLDINVGDMVLSYNIETGKSEYKPVLNFYDQGIKEVYKLELDDGRELTGTADHKILVNRRGIVEYVNLIDVIESDVVL